MFVTKVLVKLVKKIIITWCFFFTKINDIHSFKLIEYTIQIQIR